MASPAAVSVGTRWQSGVLGISAAMISLLGGLLFGLDSLLAVDVAIASVLEARTRRTRRPLLGWTSVLVSIGGAGFFAWFWYSYFWSRFHHPGDGGPSSPPRDILTVMLVASAAVGLVGLLAVVARYGPDSRPSGRRNESSGYLTSR